MAEQRIECVLGDLTKVPADVIVNAANSTLRGGGGVDGAIHRAAGPELLAECVERHPDGCPTGEARITKGYRLPCKYVVHTVGPVYRDGQTGEPELLARCYLESLDLAAAHGARSVAFPAISTGAFGYPWREAARVAVRAIREGLERHPEIEQVRIMVLDPELRDVFEQELRAVE